MGYKQQLTPTRARLLGQLELALMGRLEELESKRTEEEWCRVDCPAIVQLFMNKQKEFARFLMAAANQDEAVGAVMKLQRNWDRRKTKQDTEERSLQEACQVVYAALQNALSDKMEDTQWEETAKQFGTNVKTPCRMLYALECDVDVADYPIVMYETDKEKEPNPVEQQDEIRAQEPISTEEQGNSGRTGRQPEQSQSIPISHDTNEDGHQTVRRERTRNEHAVGATRPDRRQGGSRQPELIAEDREADIRQYPETPRRRRANPDTPGFGGWDMIDSHSIAMREDANGAADSRVYPKLTAG